MNLTIFGATGQTGIPLVQQSLEAGHNVTVLVRTPAKLIITHPNLTIIQGDATIPADVNQVISSATDAVISALGPGKNSPSDMMNRAAEAILQAMRQNGVTRLIWMTGAGVRVEQDQPKLIDKFIRFAMQTFTSDVLKQSEDAVEIIRKSQLDWTVFRAPMLTNDPATHDIKTGWVGVNTGMKLTRADAAHFMLQEVTNPRHIKSAPMISN